MVRLPDTSWQTLHNDDLWQAFRSIGNGLKAFPHQASDGKHIWIGARNESGDEEFYVEPRIMEELQACGFVKVTHDNLPSDVDEGYELSEEGRQVYETLKEMPPELRKDKLLSLFRERWRELNPQT